MKILRFFFSLNYFLLTCMPVNQLVSGQVNKTSSSISTSISYYRGGDKRGATITFSSLNMSTSLKRNKKVDDLLRITRVVHYAVLPVVEQRAERERERERAQFSRKSGSPHLRSVNRHTVISQDKEHFNPHKPLLRSHLIRYFYHHFLVNEFWKL